MSPSNGIIVFPISSCKRLITWSWKLSWDYLAMKEIISSGLLATKGILIGSHFCLISCCLLFINAVYLLVLCIRHCSWAHSPDLKGAFSLFILGKAGSPRVVSSCVFWCVGVRWCVSEALWVGGTEEKTAAKVWIKSVTQNDGCQLWVLTLFP